MPEDLTKRFNINRFGKGEQSIIFAHGFGCDQNVWRFLTPSFEEDYDIILFDHIGSGKSDESKYDFKKYNSLQGYADDLVELLDSLHIEKAIFVGHSVSSMIGILLANNRPDLIEKLVLVCPSPCYINDENYQGGFSKQDIDELIETLESNFLGWSSFITPIIVGNQDTPEFSEELNNSFCRMNPEIAKHFAKVTFLGDNREDLSKISTPTLILQCNPDVIAPLEVGKYMHEEMQKSKLILLEASGHCPHLTSPDNTIKAIESYLNN